MSVEIHRAHDLLDPMSPVAVRDLWPDVIKAGFQLLHIPPAVVDIAVQLKSGFAPDPMSAAAKNAIDDRDRLLKNEFRDLHPADREGVEELMRSLLAGALDDYEVLRMVLEDPAQLPSVFMHRIPPNEPDTEDAANYLHSLLRIVCAAITKLVEPTDVQTRALHAGVGQILRSLTDLSPVGRITHGGIPSLSPVEPRVLTEASLAAVLLAGPKTLPEVNRLEYLGSESDAILNHFPLVVLGEGGSGKSVVATQLFAHYAESSSGLTLFIACSQVPASQDVSSLDALDFALARAVGQIDVRLSDLVTGVPDVTLVIDTVDLVLSEENADSCAELILLLSHRAKLVLTCRAREWDDFLANNPRLEVYSVELPQLDSRQVVAWAKLYVDQRLQESVEGSSFLQSLELAVEKSSAEDLFGSPVRLAMTCDIYAATGALPDSLTVTSLYDAYWDAKVDRDRRGRRGRNARPRGEAARRLAQKIWESSERRFTEFVAVDALESGMTLLISEGVVRTVGEKGGFFHQTFAEYAVARHLSAHGNASDWTSLRNALDRGSASEWGIISHLVILPLDEVTFRDVIEFLPRDSPEGLRLLLRSAAGRMDTSLLAEIVKKESQTRPRNLAASLDALASASVSASNAAIPLVVHLAAERDGRTRFFMSLSRLLEKATSMDKTTWLSSAIEVALDSPSPTLQGDLVTLSENTLGRSPSSYQPGQLMHLYEHVPQGVRALLATSFACQPSERFHSFLEVALRFPAPLKATDSLLTIAEGAYGHQVARELLGWTSWRRLLDAEYPVGWRMIQTHLVARMLTDEQIHELVGALAEPHLVHRKEYTDVGLINARLRPDAVARAVSLAVAQPETAVASSLAQVVRELSAHPVDRATLSRAIRPLREACPLDVEPALASLAANDPNLVERGVRELVGLSQSARDADDQRVVRRTWDAYFQYFALGDVSRFEYELEISLRADTPRERLRLARLWARLCPVSGAARDAVSALFMDRGKAHLASEAAKILEQRAEEMDAHPHAEWLAGLLDSNYAYPVAVIARLLARDAIARAITRESMERVLSRALTSLESREDTQTLRALLSLLASIARTPGTPMTTTAVEALLEAMWRPLGTWRNSGYPAAERFPGLYQQLNFAITAVAVPILPEADLIGQVRRLIIELDTGSIGIQPRRSLANSLIVTTNRFPLSWTRIDACWSEASISNKLAMAEWITHGKVPGKEKIALAIARRNDCPAFVAHYIHKSLAA